MPYIRSNTNPERLYIWEGQQGTYFNCWNEDTKTIPDSTFHDFLSKYKEEEWYLKLGDEDIEYEGIRLTTRMTPHYQKLVLSYEDWEIEMWEVTWEYIVNNST